MVRLKTKGVTRTKRSFLTLPALEDSVTTTKEKKEKIMKFGKTLKSSQLPGWRHEQGKMKEIKFIELKGPDGRIYAYSEYRRGEKRPDIIRRLKQLFSDKR